MPIKHEPETTIKFTMLSDLKIMLRYVLNLSDKNFVKYQGSASHGIGCFNQNCHEVIKIRIDVKLNINSHPTGPWILDGSFATANVFSPVLSVKVLPTDYLRSLSRVLRNARDPPDSEAPFESPRFATGIKKQCHISREPWGHLRNHLVH